MFENWQGIKPMVLSAPCDNYLKNIFTNIKINKKTYGLTQKLQGINPMGLSAPCGYCLKKNLPKNENVTNNLTI